MPHAAPPRILFIDAYDSFTNNIVSLLETRLRAEVTIIKIDDPINDFAGFLKPFTAVVAGPGPGDPRTAKDVGLYNHLWNLQRENLLPVLGICLGFQSLVLAFGGTIERLPEPRHGIIRSVASHGESMFQGVDQMETIQYHSLHASLGHNLMSTYDELWEPSSACPELQPLAWDFEIDNMRDVAPWKSLEASGRVLMAVHHMAKPFYGIQFHAESICSSGKARRVIDSWWAAARSWQRALPCTHDALKPEHGKKLGASRTETNGRARATWNCIGLKPTCQPSSAKKPVRSPESRARMNRENDQSPIVLAGDKHREKTIQVFDRVIDTGRWSTPTICDALGFGEGDSIVLDSGPNQDHELANHSIIGFVEPESLRFEYSVITSELLKIENGRKTIVCLVQHSDDVFAYLKDFLRQYRVSCKHTNIPFWGGLMGYISYEACLETIGVNKQPSNPAGKRLQRPDLSFVFVERSLVVDYAQGKTFIQSIKPDDDEWLDSSTSRLSQTACGTFSCRLHKQGLHTSESLSTPTRISLPNEALYKSQIRACQDSIRAGDSYELCLTTQATIKTVPKRNPWRLYQKLRHLNPAPFSAYIRLGTLALLSSSPERFLSWSRPKRKVTNSDWHNGKWSDKISICQFRPIKGTVKKRTGDLSHPYLTIREATELLSTTKERAENLMIVDLIRHDLHGVVGSGNVTVPKLMVVEEYATVFQLVSVIEGELVIDDSDDEEDFEDDVVDSETLSDYSDGNPSSTSQCISSKSDASHSTSARGHSRTGIDVLAASLPPGSMTGAPKLRSCQLLGQLENRHRGIYSGVVGYLDVGGGGDFSVVIRTAVRWDTDTMHKDDMDGQSTSRCGAERTKNMEEDDEDEWTIGAGGAVTSLSTEDGEWEEMLTKLRSTLRLFEDKSEW
ncbi:hypothetical protein N7G274_008083 [Stereocaulon virgatum]|uniref:aminodeoxychorismate synthase n=1 Tax=Stereocaulon virgatum TaxID=373712 RepID=A0ABR4A2P2_9LECA